MRVHEAISRIRFLLDVGGSDGFTSADKEALNMAIKSLAGGISEKTRTNADRIRQMTDEELADVMQGQCACCAYQLSGCTEKECKDGAYEWLKQELSEDVGTDC